MRFTALLFSICLPLNALTIQIDYRYDSNNFFSASGNPQGAEGASQAKAALEAAAARWSAIINETLQPIIADDHSFQDVRLSFPDPSNFSPCVPTEANPCPPGVPRLYDFYEVSSAASSASDSLVSLESRPPANQYRNGISIPANTFIIYVGARSLPLDAFTGGFIGHNHNETIEKQDSILNRGFNSGSESLPTWGSSISFNSDEDFTNDPFGVLERKWHFDHTTVVPGDAKDFYSVALAEIGHALGVGLFFQDWTRFVFNSQFRGVFTRAAYLAENGSPITGLDLQGPDLRYFSRGAYTSKIFNGGTPNYIGTVGPGIPQALLFQARHTYIPGSPIEDYVPGIIHGSRFEITNLDVAAIRDIGWSAIASAPENEVSFVTLTRGPGGVVTLAFPSEVDTSYTIQTSTNLIDWMNVTPELNSEGTTTDWNDGETGFNDPLGPSLFRREKYYRVLKND